MEKSISPFHWGQCFVTCPIQPGMNHGYRKFLSDSCFVVIEAHVCRHLSEDAFADVYKVEPISGIFIASQVIAKPIGHNIGPQHLASVISFDHGASWRPIKAPLYDEEGQQIACQLENNCSLHLSQKFTHYYPDIRAIGILSSKSAPGLIIATGVIGRHLKVSF